MQATIPNCQPPATSHQPPILTPRLAIVPFSENTLTPRYVSWLNDPEVVRYSEQRHQAHTLDSCREYWQSFTETPHCFWAIVARDPALGHIGNINAYINEAQGVADVGILIGERAVWGQGYGSEAWQAVCRHLLQDCSLRRITGGTLSVNAGMLKIMQRAGMTETEQPRRQLRFEGQWVDVVQMALERTALERTPALHVALVGCGSIGRRHLANLCAHVEDQFPPVSTNITIFDASPETGSAVAQEFGVHSVACPEDLWERKPDVCFVCTPSNLHTPFALAAANAGAHLFLEKPVAHILDGLDELNAEITRRNLISLVGCNMRFHPGPKQIKQWLEAGIIGEILSARLHTGSYLPAWRPGQEWRASYSASPTHGGALLDCIHELDLASWLLGPAELYSAFVRPAISLGLDTDGMAELLLTHQSGAISSVHLNFVQRNYRRSIEIIGGDGSLYWDFNAGEAVHYDASGKIAQCVRQPEDWQINQMYSEQLAYFLACVRRQSPTFNPVSQAMETLRIALQARNRKGVRQ